MKIRTGFVSNSSSSSFCIYGISVEKCQLIRVLNEKFNLVIEEGSRISKIEDKVYEAKIDLPQMFTTNDDYRVYIGREFSSIQDDETGRQFKNGVEEEIKKIFGEEEKCGTIEEGWYNG